MYPQKIFFLHISSSYAKILEQKLFRTREIPQSGSKAKDRKREKERPKVGNNNGQLRIATPPWVAHAKPPGPKKSLKIFAVAYGCFFCFLQHAFKFVPAS